MVVVRDAGVSHEIFNDQNFYKLCDSLAAKHSVFESIIKQHGYPPLWSRKPTFETLIHIILEQQVSLASALAAFVKLKEVLPTITPPLFLLLNDEALKACYFSRQKIIYTRHLASLIVEGEVCLDQFENLENDTISTCLKKVKGIGDWTANIYLMMALHRADIFPINDIALINSMKHEMQLPADTLREELLLETNSWKPYRTIAAYLLWHAYLSRRKRV